MALHPQIYELLQRHRDELRDFIRQETLDPAFDASQVAEAASLLDELGKLELDFALRTAILFKRAEGLVTSGELPPDAKLSDWAYRVLATAGGPMPYREIAAVMKAQGYKHARPPKNPDRQLSDSVWVAMNEDDRFRKVGRGIFDLTERVAEDEA